jgi:hypothetical protein
MIQSGSFKRSEHKMCHFKKKKKIHTGSLQSMATVTYLENGSPEILEIWYGVKSI